MKIARYVLGAVCFVGLAGCAALKAAPESPRSTIDAQQDPSYLVNQETLKNYAEETDLDRKRLMRNEVVDERMLEIDHQFGEFERKLWRQGVEGNIGIDWLQLAIAGSTATVGGETVKSALGAASAGIAGAKTSFDKQTFLDKTLPAIIAQMVAEREKIRALIEQSKTLSATDYTLYGALGDLMRYIRAGTIPGVLQVIAEDAGAKAVQAEEDIKDVHTAQFIKDDAGQRLRKFWKPDGTNIDAANAARLEEWMRKNGLATGPGELTMFLRDREKADLRVRAARELLDK